MLDVQHLSVAYGVTEVLRDVSFTVPERSIVALLGGNGSGKTTTLNVLSGLLAQRGGAVRFRGPLHRRAAEPRGGPARDRCRCRRGARCGAA